jgi:hypothetical protein
LLLNTHARDERLKKEELDEEEKRKVNEHIGDMVSEIEVLKEELDKKEEELAKSNKQSSILHDLFEKNVIDREGNLPK